MHYMTCSNNRIYRFEGTDGATKMHDALKMFRFGFKTIGPCEVESVRIFSKEEPGDVMSDELEYLLAGGSSVLIKPNGSEQTIEVSLTTDNVNGDTTEIAEQIWNDIEGIIYIDFRAGYCCE